MVRTFLVENLLEGDLKTQIKGLKNVHTPWSTKATSKNMSKEKDLCTQRFVLQSVYCVEGATLGALTP